VLDNWAFEAGKLTEADANKIINHIDARLQGKGAKKTEPLE
jgi:hypothetical protein